MLSPDSVIEWASKNPLFVCGILFLIYRIYQSHQPFPETGGQVQKIEDKSQYDELIQSSKKKLVVLEFFATWWGPCKSLAPRYGQMSTEHSSVIFAQLDVDVCKDVARLNGVSAMPTFKIYKDSVAVGTIQGFNQAKIVEIINTHKFE